MRIFNQNKEIELNKNSVDLESGYLLYDKLFIAHHDEEEAIEEKGHYETIKEYSNGGKDVKWVIDVEGKTAKAAYDEYENIQVYIPYTAEELKERADKKRHAELKAELEKVMEDIGQEQLGIVRDDYSEKKARAAVIINELRVLEGKAPREVVA